MRILASHHITRGLSPLFSDERFIATSSILWHRYNKIPPGMPGLHVYMDLHTAPGANTPLI